MATSLKLKELSKKEIMLASGHRLCQGCGAAIVAKMVLLAIDKPVVACSPTGCLEVSTCISDYTAWKIPWIHSAFENAGATIAGVETMYRALKKKGRINEDISFLVFAGDGGTYDIGIQSLSGAMERGHDMLYICYDNGAYMNTGTQRSSATPFGASTTTTPAGSEIHGKLHHRKDIVRIMASHGIPYAAQASISNHVDLMRKVQKAMEIKGPKFMNILAPCHRGWRSSSNDAVAISRLAVSTCLWPLFEIENGKTKLNYVPKEKLPIENFLRPQGRFAHLFQPQTKWILEELQKQTDADWAELVRSDQANKAGAQN